MTTRYSRQVLQRAERVVEEGLIRWAAGSTSRTLCRSLNGDREHTSTLHFGPNGEILGVTCTCPNGRSAGLRAHCYHAAAAELFCSETSRKEQS